MEIRAATGADQPEVEAVVAAAFGGPHGDHVVEMVRALDATGATRASLVAVDAGDVVGHVQLSRCWVDARARLVEVAVLSPLAVVPSRQRDGIGSALVEAALTEARRQGFPAVFLEGSPDYYGRRGFAAAIPLGFQPPTPRIPAPAFQVAPLAAYEPWMTGALVYCDAFWSTDSAGLRDPRLAAIEASLAELDSAPREVTVPADLRAALEAEPRARRRFDALSYSHQQRWVLYVEEAKTEATRRRRVAKTVTDLQADAG